MKYPTNQWDAYPLLNNKIPGPATQSIANEELDEIKWDIEDYVIEPDHTSPTPSNPFNCSKAPICIDRNYCGNLLAVKDLIINFST